MHLKLSWCSVMSIHAPLAFFLEHAIQRIKHDEAVGINNCVNDSRDDCSSGECENAEQAADHGESFKDHHRSDLSVIALKD